MRYGQKIRVNFKYLTGLDQDCYNIRNNGPLGLPGKAESYRKKEHGFGVTLT